MTGPMSQPTRILIALLAGVILGIAGARFGWEAALGVADPLGGVWLDALRMTIIPLVVALLVTGIGRTADSARGGGLALKAVGLFLVMLWTSAALGAILTPLALDLWPMPAESAAALKTALGGTHVAVAEPPPLAQFLRSIVPTNPIAAAAADNFLPLILFTTLFGIASTMLNAERRERIIGFFDAVSEAMLVMVGWVLWLAPVGVFALAFAVGVRAGSAAIGALLHYIVIVAGVGLLLSLTAYPIARYGGRVRLSRFARAVLPAQAVALSTQSSLATLPQMLSSSTRIGVPETVSAVTLPLAVALFRVTGPAMNVAVAIYVAHWFGQPLTVTALASGAVVAAITTMGAVSLPGQVSFLTSIVPIAAAMGVPIEPLALLIAVEMLPDLVRTVGNVTMDVAATTMVARLSGDASEADEPAHVALP